MTAASSRSSGTPQRLRVCYLLEDTAMFGGVKVVLHHANLLTERGHDVTVVTKGRPADWYPLRAKLEHVADFRTAALPEADVTVATYWTTVDAALRAPGEVAHFCQGLEFIYTHNRADHEAIREAYRAGIPALTVSPHLEAILRGEFRKPTRSILQPLEPFWRRRVRWRPRRRPRILVAGPFEADWKGVSTALEAVAELRRAGGAYELVRVSSWPLGEAERALVEPEEFHCHLAPRDVARVVRGCDLHLAPSWEQEGFGLPVLESMASGVPVIASDIAAFRGFAANAADLVDARSSAAFADAALAVLRDVRRWRAMRRAGVRDALPYRESSAATSIEQALFWVAGGAWRKASQTSIST